MMAILVFQHQAVGCQNAGQVWWLYIISIIQRFASLVKSYF